jgi:outer membrane immunogenic protein
MKKFLLLSAALLASTGTAHANDFNGFRIEAQTGLDVLSGREQNSTVYDYDGEIEVYGPNNYSNSVTGFQFGLGVGYDAEISPNIVAGVEASIAFSDAKTDYYDYDFSLSDDEYFNADTLKAKREIELGARLGYKVNPSTLVYIKGGYVNGRFKVNGEAVEYETEDDRDYSFSKNRSGYRVSGGIETLVSSNAYVKLEYRYTNFKDIKLSETYDLLGYDGDASRTDSYRLGLSRHQVAAGIGFRF